MPRKNISEHFKPSKMKNTDIQTLENLLYNCKLSKKYFLKKDEIKGKTIALASTGENESVNIHSNFMTYSEMKAYLFGLYDGLNKKFK